MSKPENSIDHVLDRMVEAMLGEDAHFKSHAIALNIPRETIKTWKRRGEVPLGTLKNFAFDWKVSLEWLLHGGQPESAQPEVHQVSENVQPYGLSADEAALLEAYRTIDPQARVTLQNLLSLISGGAHAGIKAPKAKLRQPRHAGEVEPVSRRSASQPAKKPRRQRGSGPGDNTK